MDRGDIRAESPAEKSRGFMPAVSVNPGRLLFTAGMTGRQPNGSIVAGGWGYRPVAPMSACRPLSSMPVAACHRVSNRCYTSPTSMRTTLRDVLSGQPFLVTRGQPQPPWWYAVWQTLQWALKLRSSSIYRMRHQARFSWRSLTWKHTTSTFIRV